MSFLGNIIWIIFGGFLVFLEYMLAGFLLCLTIIGIPFGVQCFKFGFLVLAPFGKKISNKGGVGSLFMNILWIIIFGIWISLSHLLIGVLLCLTIIGIPFGVQHFKLALLSLLPFGKTVT